jgi:apolipoprotein D and lipocalin family protein
MVKIMHIVITILMSLILTSCTGLPDAVYPVNDFDINRYLGKWYEIARLDHSFERGLNKVSAEYALRDDGGVSVINRGFSNKTNDWKETEGKAYFVDDPSTGHLKVSFFGPFYGSYVVFELDEDEYQYAFVAGYNKSYLWLLSRTPDVNEDIMERFVKRSSELGFDTEALIFVEHD